MIGDFRMLRYLYPITLGIIEACASFKAGQDHPLLLEHVGHPLLIATATLPQCRVDETLQQPVPACFVSIPQDLNSSIQSIIQGAIPVSVTYSCRGLQSRQQPYQVPSLPTKTQHPSRPSHPLHPSVPCQWMLLAPGRISCMSFTKGF